MSLQSQFRSKVLLEKIEPLTVIKNELEIGMNQNIISPDIKDEIDIEYHIIPENLIKSEPISNNLLESEHLESVETQISIQTENTLFIKTEFENLVKTEDSGGHLSVVSGSTYKKRKPKTDNCCLKYHCNKCKYKTLLRKNLEKHKVMHLKPNKIQYLCYHCPYKSNYRRNLTRHVFNHFKNGEVPFHCYICDFVTSKRNLIIEHFKKHPEHRSKWNETEYKNQVEAYIKKRIRYYCKKCKFQTHEYAELKLHELSHEGDRDDQHLKYRCDQCKYKTFRVSNFNRHKLLHLEKMPYLYCDHCSYKSKRKNHLKDHILRHFKNKEVPFHQCDKCTYKTFIKENLNKHKLIHLRPEEIQWFYCYHCSYKAKRKSHLKVHILRHFKHEEVPFHCYICDFVTKKRDLIIEHFKKHPEHVSKCDETDYEINLKLTPNIKKRYELTQKSEVEMADQYLKYQCDKCTYKTFLKNSFNRHKLIHLKPEEIQYFYCYHCSYKAKRKSLVRVHIMRHFKNEVVKFHCYMCNFMTLKRKSITEHIKKHSKVQDKSKINQRP